jgi:hypothetical protein
VHPTKPGSLGTVQMFHPAQGFCCWLCKPWHEVLKSRFQLPPSLQSMSLFYCCVLYLVQQFSEIDQNMQIKLFAMRKLWLEKVSDFSEVTQKLELEPEYLSHCDILQSPYFPDYNSLFCPFIALIELMI